MKTPLRHNQGVVYGVINSVNAFVGTSFEEGLEKRSGLSRITAPFLRGYGLRDAPRPMRRFPVF